ncbi:MAG: 1-acyl-sn-glycerol-3-phosphate acyltransferase [Thermoanaerobaculia bacterium]|nr:1-acyl-sn-glycerol-3-phosphate acyltransferase [Thermoanaerobaculia bacterium]MDI9631754.1 1-acyl-sn-glycerol-3-phosphate acyltransferase [Acidobacteriota bacterium]MBP7813211.1 1-acyl-sn-glycerol-3-phosphate acyltransferase [Thermoanaerobaculia bacterium]MBP8845058.1 1-acyl-sn-glycerol-3-phosphate acyltransferase [Thermoanaerobaculia bacterium]HPA96761.1 1-acyl-sn-glycerol-3-phosphate acyltransferase [Thermoanaerobaculia bacterium]
MRQLVTWCLLATVKTISHLFFRAEVGWIGPHPEPPFRDLQRLRVVAILNHTSLYEPIFTITVPYRFLWRIARHGVVAIAEKTLKRPVVGRFFSLIAAHVASVTRERDHTWRAVLSRIGPDSMVLILPEGRMMRANGLDANGEPMTVRGGIADILEAVGDGEMLVAYSGGLHHVQAPGELLARPFRRIRMNFERLDIATYNEARQREAAEIGDSFKRRVKEDLEARRDRNCPRAAA